MIRRGSAILLPAFGILLALIIGFSVAVTVVLNRTEVDVARIHANAKEREKVLTALYSDVHRLAIRVRDVLFDAPIRPGGPSLSEMREALLRDAEMLDPALGAKDPQAIRELHASLRRYADLSAEVDNWSSAKKAAEGRQYLSRKLIPARTEILESAASVAELNAEVLDERQAEVLDLQRRTREHLRTGSILMAAVALVTAVLAVRKVRSAEQEAEAQQALARRHEEELRLLSKSLVESIETERKVLSRELHDEVGQILTALKMELAALSSTRSTDTATNEVHLAEAKRLASETLKTVRHMALGLRPSLLDDLGLAPALRWQAREHAQRAGVDVQVDVGDNLDEVSEPEKVCLFRVVQEALTNCSRHAGATSIHVLVRRDYEGTILQVKDNGRGFDSRAGGSGGIGLIGIEERVRELNGTFEIRSKAGSGTILSVQLPLGS